jgi:hypothetical protein
LATPNCTANATAIHQNWLTTLNSFSKYFSQIDFLNEFTVVLRLVGDSIPTLEIIAVDEAFRVADTLEYFLLDKPPLLEAHSPAGIDIGVEGAEDATDSSIVGLKPPFI